MDYYHIHLREDASNLCKRILPWVKYRYKRLPMGISNFPEILHEKMNRMFHRSEFIWAYIYELLIITKCDCSNNMKILELSLHKIKENGLKCNTKKIFIQTKMENLEFWVTRNEIRPINKKVEGHGEYDSTKDQTSGSIIYRISNILQGHVR